MAVGNLECSNSLMKSLEFEKLKACRYAQQVDPTRTLAWEFLVEKQGVLDV